MDADNTIVDETVIDEPPARLGGGSLRKDAALMVGATLLSRLTGMVQIMVFAHRFGASADLSAFQSALLVPNFVYFLIAGGALRTGFVPVLSEHLARGEREKLWRTFNNLFWIMLIFGGAVVAVGMALAPALGQLVAPGWKGDPAQMAKVGQMMRIMLPAQLFLMLGGGLFMGALTAHKHFVWPAIGPIVYNCFIIGAALAAPWFFGIRTVAYGLVLGAVVANFGLQIPPLVRRGARISLRINLRDEEAWRILKLAAPVMLGLSVGQISWTVVQIFASYTGQSGVAVMEYANRLWQLPSGLFAAAIGIALLPSLSDHFTRRNDRGYTRDFSFGMRNTLFLALPTTLALGILRFPIIRVIFESGKFKPEYTPLVAGVMVWLTPAMVAMSLVFIVARAFYARQDPLTPVWAGLVTVAICVTLGRLRVGPLQLVGLAIAISVGSLVNAGVLLAILKRRVTFLDGRRILGTVARMLPGLIGMAAVMWLVNAELGQFLGTRRVVEKLLGLVLPLGLGGLVFVIFSVFTRCEELQSAWQLVLRRTRSATPPPEELPEPL